MSFKIKNNQIVLDLPKNMSNRQKRTVQLLLDDTKYDNASRYVQSFLGQKISVYSVKDIVGSLDYRHNKSHNIIIHNRYLKQQKKLLDTGASHVPKNFKNDYIGVEIECCIPDMSDKRDSCGHCDGSGEVFNEDTDNYISCIECDGTGESETSNSNKRSLKIEFEKLNIPRVSIKDDGSLNSKKGFFTIEFNILTRIGDMSNLEQTCQWLNKIGATVNKSCGLHIHIDSRHLSELDLHRVMSNYKKALPVLLGMVPNSRRNNTYCKAAVGPLTSDTSKRYYAVNMTAFKKYKTVEIRLHSSTTDFTKIKNWIDLNVAIFKGSITRNCKDINDLTNHIDISESLMEYVGQRTALFNDGTALNQYTDLDADEISA